MNSYLMGIKQNIFAIHQLTMRDKKHENSATFMGELWEILNPAIIMLVMVLVFSEMLGTDTIKNYPVFVLTGLTMFNLFSNGTIACLEALVDNKNLLIMSQLNRRVYVVQRVALVLRNFLFSLFVYAFVLALFEYSPQSLWLVIIIDIILLTVLILGIGKILAVANVYFADTTYFWRIFTVFVFYGSALFFSVERLPQAIQDLMIINPIYDAIHIAREMIMSNYIVEARYWIALAVYAAVFYIIGTYVFNKYSDDVVAKI